MDIKCQKMTDVSVKQSFAKEPYKRDHILQKRPLETQSSPPYKDGYQMSEDDCGDGRWLWRRFFLPENDCGNIIFGRKRLRDILFSENDCRDFFVTENDCRDIGLDRKLLYIHSFYQTSTVETF